MCILVRKVATLGPSFVIYKMKEVISLMVLMNLYKHFFFCCTVEGGVEEMRSIVLLSAQSGKMACWIGFETTVLLKDIEGMCRCN